MSTYSQNLGIELIGTGEQSGTWGVTTNTNLGILIEQAISGYVTQAMADADQTITIPDGATGVARNMYIECIGELTAARNLIVPTNKKLYFIFNNTVGGFDITVKVTGQTGVSVANGGKMVLVSNGSDIVTAIDSVGGGAVTAVSVVSANGMSGSSSGGATPALTLTVGAINLSTATSLPISTGVSGLGTNVSVFLAYPSRARRTRSTTLAIPNVTQTIVAYPNLVFDNLGELDIFGRFTPQYAGVYRVSWAIGADTAAWILGQAWQVTLFKNSDPLGYAVGNRWMAQVAHTGYAYASGTTLVSLVVGDWIDTRVYQDQGGTLNTFPDTNYAFIDVERVS